MRSFGGRRVAGSCWARLGRTRRLADLASGTGSIYIVTDDPDNLFERARRAGARVVRELRDEDYCSRGFTVRDPEGVYWSFGTYAGE